MLSKIKVYVENFPEPFEIYNDWDKLVPRIQMAGMKVYKPLPGLILNREKIIGFELMDEVFEPEEEPVRSETPEPVKPEEPKVQEAPKEKTFTEMTNDERIKYLIEKSSCKHPEHDIYYVDGFVGKAKKPVRRYFPVCTNCGLREKFVKADSLTDEEKANAKLWDK